MENTEKEIQNDPQLLLFDQIRKVLSPKDVLLHAVSDFLEISDDSTYCRIRGKTSVSFREAVQLSKRFGISLDSIVGNHAQSSVQFDYTPTNFSDLNELLVFAKNMSSTIERLMIIPGSKFLLTVDNFSIFNILSHKELALFHLFSWHKNMFGFAAGYDDFVKEPVIDELLECFKKIVRGYQSIYSSELWSENVLTTTLNTINYHYEMEHFSSKNIPMLLCDQLNNIIDTSQNWAETGTKEKEGADFNLYICDYNIGTNFVIIKSNNFVNCIIDLFTLSDIRTSNKIFCKETENWIKHLFHRSILISGTSQKERHKFFNLHRQKINVLQKKIKNHR